MLKVAFGKTYFHAQFRHQCCFWDGRTNAAGKRKMLSTAGPEDYLSICFIPMSEIQPGVGGRSTSWVACNASIWPMRMRRNPFGQPGLRRSESRNGSARAVHVIICTDGQPENGIGATFARTEMCLSQVKYRVVTLQWVYGVDAGGYSVHSVGSMEDCVSNVCGCSQRRWLDLGHGHGHGQSGGSPN